MSRLYRIRDGVYMTRDGRMCIERLRGYRNIWDISFMGATGGWRVVRQVGSLREARVWLAEQTERVS